MPLGKPRAVVNMPSVLRFTYENKVPLWLNGEEQVVKFTIATSTETHSSLNILWREDGRQFRCSSSAGIWVVEEELSCKNTTGFSRPWIRGIINLFCWKLLKYTLKEEAISKLFTILLLQINGWNEITWNFRSNQLKTGGIKLKKHLNFFIFFFY